MQHCADRARVVVVKKHPQHQLCAVPLPMLEREKQWQRLLRLPSGRQRVPANQNPHHRERALDFYQSPRAPQKYRVESMHQPCLPRAHRGLHRVGLDRIRRALVQSIVHRCQRYLFPLQVSVCDHANPEVLDQPLQLAGDHRLQLINTQVLWVLVHSRHESTRSTQWY